MLHRRSRPLLYVDCASYCWRRSGRLSCGHFTCKERTFRESIGACSSARRGLMALKQTRIKLTRQRLVLEYKSRQTLAVSFTDGESSNISQNGLLLQKKLTFGAGRTAKLSATLVWAILLNRTLEYPIMWPIAHSSMKLYTFEQRSWASR